MKKKELKKLMLEWLSNYEYWSECSKDERDQKLLEMIKLSFTYHYENNIYYKALCDKKNFTPENIQRFIDIYDIPTISVQEFKESNCSHLISCDIEDIEYEMRSTGTSGIPSISRRCSDTLDLASTALLSQYRNYFKFSKGVSLFLFPSAAEVPEMGMVKVLNYTAGMVDEIFVGVKSNRVLYEKCAEFLKNFEGKTVRNIVGPPFMIDKFMRYLEKNNIDLKLDSESYVITLGGWKRFTGNEMSSHNFREKITEVFGMNPKNIRDMYALAECNFLAIEDENHKKIIPHYVKFVNKDYKSRTDVIENNIGKGVLSIFDPTILSYPGFIETTDLVSLSEDNRNNYLTYLSRVKGAEFGCCAVNLDKNMEND